MKFKKITGTNFKNYDSVEFAPTKTTTAIVGSNGHGKTTMTQMVRYALTGDLPDEAVKAGKDTLEVKLEMEDETGATINWERSKSNTKPSKVKVNGKNSTGKALAAYIESIAGVPLESLRLSSSSELIENLKPDEFSDFIMTYIPEMLDYDTVKGYMGTSVDPLVFTVLEDPSREIIPLTGKFGYDQLQKTYNYLFEQRKLTRSALATYDGKIKNTVVEKPSMELADVNKRLEEILKEEGGLANAMKAVETYNKALDARKKQEVQIEELEKQIAALSVKRPDPMLKTTLETKKRELNASIVSLQTTVATMKSNIETFKVTIENLSKPMCPLSEGLVCKTDKTAKKQEFEDKIKSNEEGIATINKEIVAKKTEYDDTVKKEAEYNEQDKRYREKLVMVQQLENLKKSLIVLPTKPVAPAPGLDYSEEKAKLAAIRNDIIRYDQYLSDFAKYTNLKREKEILDELVSMFAPKGEVTVKITQHYFGVFEDVCNNRASELRPGFTLKFVPEDGIKILCETKPGVGYIPYQSCSSGERAFVIFLLTDLISSALSRANILILDDLDKLDKDAFDALMNCVMQPSVQDAYDHIIICAVDHDDTLEVLDKYSDIEVIKI